MRILIFLGSVRESNPPKPERVGKRVALYLKAMVEGEGHSVEVVDPLDIQQSPVFKPHFSYSKEQAPVALAELSQKIEAADGYIMLSPEYNHSMSPALSHLLNHFGSSSFSYKPSLIATYSQGQWGGARAAMSMRNFLGELGCISVSSMIHVPKAHEVFTEQGDIAENQNSQRWESYFQRSLAQLYWWGQACLELKKVKDPHQMIESFKKSPAQRNAP